MITDSVWSISDQALFGVGNLLANILLARWMSPQEYGAFVIAYTIYLAIMMAHTALFVQPALVLAIDEFRAETRSYIRSAFKAQAAAGVIAGLLLSLTGAWMGYVWSNPVAWTLIPLGISVPLMLSHWFSRRTAGVGLGVKRAAISSAIYFVAFSGGCLILHRTGLLTAASAIAACGTASTIAVLPALRSIAGFDVEKPKDGFRRRMFSAHLQLARWGGASNGLMWVRDNAVYVLLSSLLGLEYAGAVRALLNFIAPPAHVSMALTAVLLPYLTLANSEGNFRRKVASLLGGAITFTTVYWVLIAILGDYLFVHAYSNRYAEHAWLLLIVGAIPIFDTTVSLLGCAMYACKWPKGVFTALIISIPTGLVTLAVGTIAWSLSGALIGMVASSAISGAVFLLLFWRRVSAEKVSTRQALG